MQCVPNCSQQYSSSDSLVRVQSAITIYNSRFTFPAVRVYCSVSFVHVRRFDGEKFKFVVFPLMWPVRLRGCGARTYVAEKKGAPAQVCGRVARRPGEETEKLGKGIERQRRTKGFLSCILYHVGTERTEKSRLVVLHLPLSRLSDWIRAARSLEPFKKQRINLHICMRPSKNFDATSGAECFFLLLSLSCSILRITQNFSEQVLVLASSK